MGSPKSKSSPAGDEDQQPARFSTILDSVARAIGSRGSLSLPDSAAEEAPGSPGGGEPRAERPKSTRQKRYSFERPGRDSSPASASPILGPNGLMGSPQNGPKDDVDAEAMLREFSSRYDLNAEATSELREIVTQMTTKATNHNGEAAPPAITYQWDQIHELIVTHSPGTSLVMVNMPDPPDMGKGTPPEQMKDMLDYMNYMEGVAENLPRVMYVHGSGQEIINFDRME